MFGSMVGAPLPRIRSVEAHGGLRVVVTWQSNGPDADIQVVDLAPAVFRYTLYAPLRDDEALFRTVRVADDGFALAWGGGDALDSVAADLGISRRLAAYYAKDREIPRTVALACRYLGGARGGGNIDRHSGS